MKMTRTKKLLAAMLVSLGMASGLAFGQTNSPTVAGSTTENGATINADSTPATFTPQATTMSESVTTTINSGYDSAGSGTGGNVVIQSLTHNGTAASVASSMTISSTGVEFKGANNTGPVKVTGVANGTSTYDAVNYGQLSAIQSQVTDLSQTVDTMKSGIASVAAMANIPASSNPKQRVSIGAGMGGYMGKSATAIGATIRITKNLTAKASISSTSGGQSASGVGIAYGW